MIEIGRHNRYTVDDVAARIRDWVIYRRLEGAVALAQRDRYRVGAAPAVDGRKIEMAVLIKIAHHDRRRIILIHGAYGNDRGCRIECAVSVGKIDLSDSGIRGLIDNHQVRDAVAIEVTCRPRGRPRAAGAGDGDLLLESEIARSVAQPDGHTSGADR